MEGPNTNYVNMPRSKLLNLASNLLSPGNSDIYIIIDGKVYRLRKSPEPPIVRVKISVVAQTSDNKVIRLETVKGKEDQVAVTVLDTKYDELND